MNLKQAIQILKDHNEWRRNDNIPNDLEMVNPTQLGIAIDIILKELEHLQIFKIY